MEDRLLTIAEIVELLGVHEQTVRRWIRDGSLPAIMLGRKSGYRIRQSDMNKFLEERSVGKIAA